MIVYLSIIFVPLGSLLAMIAGTFKTSHRHRLLFMGMGICLTPFVFEGVLASVNGRSANLETVLLSVLMTAGSAVLSIFLMHA